MSVSGRGAPSALVLWPCRPASRAVTSSREESMTASAPAASAVCRRPGMTSATATCLTPRSLSHITAPSPMGPPPKTTTLSAGRACERFTQCRATAIGSLSAATSKGRSSGKTATLVPATAFWMSRYSLMPPSVPPHPMMPRRRGLRVDDDPVAGLQAGDLGAYLDDLAGLRVRAGWMPSALPGPAACLPSARRPRRCRRCRRRVPAPAGPGAREPGAGPLLP